MTGPRFALVAAELRERIGLGDYARSGALESEAEIGARYGVSRVTVRRALELLRDEGLIVARRGSGWFVVAGAAFGQTLALGTFQHAGSAILESGTALVRRVVDYAYVSAPADIARLLALDDGAEVLRVRTVRRAGKRPLDVATEWIPVDVASPVSRAEAESPGVWETLRLHGHEIDVVRQSIAATAASEDVAALLEAPSATALLLVRRLALLAGGRPLALAEHRYLGHRFRLDVEFRGGPAMASADPPGVTAIT
jgi:GntR family transcriptional regulator